MLSTPCPCTSGKTFNKCCGPFLDQGAIPKTVKQLMRSRYSAFAIGGHGDYLLATWHPDFVPGLTAGSLSEKTLNWQGLRILDSMQHGNEGSVEFQARFIDSNNKPGLHHEVSRFIRVRGKWLYRDGKLLNT